MKKKDRSAVYLGIKTFFLSLTFIIVVYAIYFLNTEGLEKTAIGQILNPQVKSQNSSKEHTSSEEKWSLCSQSLVALSYYEENGDDSWKILKSSEGWSLIFKQAQKSLDKERFAQCSQEICEISVYKEESQDFVEFGDSLNYTYSDSSQNQLRINHEKGLLFHKGQVYKADKLIRFLKAFPKSSCH